ncbi:MAG: pre-peptidase C-terminal domain-containing protein [Gammaproteobacteria bacterium]|jgi:hypothetical protein
MSKKNLARLFVTMAACLFAAMAQAGNAITESEPNNPIAGPEQLTTPADVSISAYLGNAGADDLDYYLFYANAGDVVTVDIDHGIGGQQSVDTVLAIFDNTSNHDILRFDDDAPDLDPGSISRLDARIDDFVAPASGYYVVGVSNYPRYFTNGGGVINASYPSQGDYTLVISGVTAAVKQIPILIKPGNNNVAPVNPRSHGKIPVAILSEPGFKPANVDTTHLTFGSSGYEASLSKCNPPDVDFNGDGIPDMLCHFDVQEAKFKLTDAEGKLRGRTKGGTQFEGSGFLKVVPMKGLIRQH